MYFFLMKLYTAIVFLAVVVAAAAFMNIPAYLHLIHFAHIFSSTSLNINLLQAQVSRLKM